MYSAENPLLRVSIQAQHLHLYVDGLGQF